MTIGLIGIVLLLLSLPVGADWGVECVDERACHLKTQPQDDISRFTCRNNKAESLVARHTLFIGQGHYVKVVTTEGVVDQLKTFLSQEVGTEDSYATLEVETSFGRVGVTRKLSSDPPPHSERSTLYCTYDYVLSSRTRSCIARPDCHYSGPLDRYLEWDHEVDACPTGEILKDEDNGSTHVTEVSLTEKWAHGVWDSDYAVMGKRETGLESSHPHEDNPRKGENYYPSCRGSAPEDSITRTARCETVRHTDRNATSSDRFSVKLEEWKEQCLGIGVDLTDMID